MPDLDTEPLLTLVRKEYPDWKGFDHPGFRRDEIDYKRAAAAKASELLGKSEFQRLLDAGDFDELTKRLVTVANATNLLFLGVPREGDLSILHQEGLDRAEFLPALFDLLHGPDDGPLRFGRYLEFLDRHGLVSKWTFPTYFLFLLHPDREMFVKPTATTAVMKLLGVEESYAGKPTAAKYELVRDTIHRLREALSGLGARDLIDVQSLLWVTYWVDRQTLVSDAKRAELLGLIQEMSATYLESPEGLRHLRAYTEEREQAAENWRRVLEARDAGQEITDLVLDGLLPHADTEWARRRGAWISHAPAVASDVRRLFESVRYVDPSNWPAVTRVIVDFVRRCVDDPEELTDACVEFVAGPYSKGFQTGMLTPILSALRPDDYIPFNGKSRLLVNHLAGRSLRQSLEDYPEANHLGRQLVGELQPLFAESGILVQLSPAAAFDAFSHWMAAVKNYPFGQQYWKVAPGERAWQWEECLEDGFIGIGWEDLGDVAGLPKKDFDERLQAALRAHPNWKKDGAGQVWTFSRIKEGDRIVANRGTSEVVGIGTVTGPYYYQDGAKYAHRLPVDWDDPTRRRVDEGGWRRTVIKLDRQKFEAVQAAPALPAVAPPGTGAPIGPGSNSPYPLSELAQESGFPEPLLERWVRAIERKKQAVLYGPPGTGKTHVAQRLARHLIGGREGFSGLVQFHPAYSYEDFLQGLRPRRSGDGGLVYDMAKGRFLDFCDRARRLGEDSRAVLIVDEINRANLARVFGELMYLLEYRDDEIPLAGGGPFRIPSNVRILGTMNTADRSIALVDHALRRRFAFLRLEPRYDVLRRYHETHSTFDPAGLIGVLGRLNGEIRDPNYFVGITFFLREDLADEMEDIWRMEVQPYVEEFFFDRPQRAQPFRWEAVAVEILSEA